MIRKFEIKIDIKTIGKYKAITSWLEENINGKWNSELCTSSTHDFYHYYAFEKEEDAIAFKLRWT